MDDRRFPLKICVLPEQAPNKARSVSYPNYIDEILGHAGVAHEKIALDAIQSALGSTRVLVTVGEFEFGDATKQALAKWIQDGGCWLTIAGICGMSDVLGVNHAAP